MVGTLGVEWADVGRAAALLFAAAVVGFFAIASEREARRSWNPAARGKRWLVVLTVALGGFGWLAMASAASPVPSALFGDTVAGTALPEAPGLVQAGIPTSTANPKPAAPDPLSLLNPGDCVEVPMEAATAADGGPTWKPGAPAPADCTTLDANYRVLQTGPAPCAGPLYKLETSRKDRAGKQLYHLCLAFDWRAGFCYDTEHMDEPSKVDCATPGDHIVQATAVFENTTDGSGCPRDGRGAVWVVWDKRQMTVCFRGGDKPGVR